MYIALNKDKRRITVQQAVHGDTFFCPFCMEKMFLKSGKERMSHFSHYPHTECKDSWNDQYDTSEWRYEWQQQFPLENQEVIVQWENVRHRADVLIDRTVIEFQHKPLSAGKFNDKNIFYHNNSGYKVIWLYDMRALSENKELAEIPNNDYIWQNSVSSFRKYILKAGRIELFFQVSDEGNCILSIEVFNDHGFIIKKRYSKEEFLQYLGMQNGQCSAPAYDDLTSNE